MKVSDYIIKYLADEGIRHIFMLTGGGAMHLNDSDPATSGVDYTYLPAAIIQELERSYQRIDYADIAMFVRR